jgi:hypothetical protein
MSICLILTGQMRTYESNEILNSYQHLSGLGEIDLYIYTWKNKGYSNAHGNTKLQNINDDKIMKEDVIHHYSKVPFFKIKEVFIESFDDFYDSLTETMKQKYNTPFQNHSSVTTSIPIEYKYQQAIRNINLSSYSKVVITRPDVKFLDTLPTLHPEEDTVYYNSICDRCIDHFWMGTPTTLTKQLYNIFDDYEKNYDILPFYHRTDNNELLILQCKKNKIRISVNVKEFCSIIHT